MILESSREVGNSQPRLFGILGKNLTFYFSGFLIDQAGPGAAKRGFGCESVNRLNTRPRAIDFSFRVRVTALKITTNGRVIFEGLFLKGYDRMSKIPIPTVLHKKILYALFEIFSEI